MYIDNILREMRPRYDEIVEKCKENGIILTVDEVKNRDVVLDGYKKQLAELMKVDKVDQRTQAWYDMRENMITASSFAQGLDKAKFGTQKEFLLNKCYPGYAKTLDHWCPPLKWGIMYEPVAIDIYQKRNHVKLHEFGLLKHEKIEYFGASPDGITEDGIMLEIKCPFRRKIVEGEFPIQYFYQMQGQLDVCKLEECDYLECKFEEYSFQEGDDLFMRLLNLPTNGERGIIIEYTENEQPVYIYSPIMSTSKTDKDIEPLVDWYNETKTNCPDKTVVHVWYLDEYVVQRINKDPVFLEENFKELDKVQEKINRYKLDIKLMEKELNLC